MASFQIPAPEPMVVSGDVAQNWLDFRAAWGFYFTATGLEAKLYDEGGNEVPLGFRQAAATLCAVMGRDCLKVVQSLPTLSAADKERPERILADLSDHFLPHRNVLFERYKFSTAVQEEGESADKFLVRLRHLSGACEFGGLTDSLIRDRLVIGTCDSHTRDRILQERQVPDVYRVMQSLQAAEVSRLHKSQMSGHNQVLGHNQMSGHKAEPDVDAVQTGRMRYTTRDRSELSKGGQSSQSWSCAWCGGKRQHPRQTCPARTATCHKCDRKGHFQAVCRGVNKNVSAVESTTEQLHLEQLYLGDVHIGDVNTDEWTATLTLNGHRVTFKLDSGAAVTVLGATEPALAGVLMERPEKKLCGAGNNPINATGMKVMTLSFRDRECQDDIYVVPGQKQPLLSRNACAKLGLLKLSVDAVSATPNPYRSEFPSLFSGLGKLKEEYKVKMSSDASPVSLYTPRRIPHPLLDQTKAEIESMCRSGVISPVQQPTDWCSGLVVIPKPGGRVRTCVDLTQLNKAVEREAYPMASVDDSLAQLSTGKLYSKLDANSGFWQIPLHEESRLLTTFITPWGRFCFNRLPFGISSAPEVFQRTMTRLLEGLPGVVCHMDDILIHGENSVDLDANVRQVLSRLADAGLTLNEAKCAFNLTSVTFLGHIVDATGVHADPRKVNAISNFSAPTTVSELRTFMGMANQLGKFLPNLSQLCGPLRALLRKESSWLWGPHQQQAFSAMKSLITRPSSLAHYDPDRATVIAADASRAGLGAVLLQVQPDGERRPVYFASRSLTPAELNYAIIELEALALTWAADRFSDYVLGMPFAMETDHKPLVPLMTITDLSRVPPRIQRFRLRLMRFAPTITHVPGKENFTADALSRAPVDKPGPADEFLVDDVKDFGDAIIESVPVSAPRLVEIKEAQRQDELLQQVFHFCKHGWPAYMPQQPLLRPYWEARAHLSLLDELLVYDDRIVMPVSQRLDALQRVHEGHLGITKCRSRARAVMWWPFMSKAIQDMVVQCQTCARVRPPPRETLLPSTFPSRPWERVGTDLFKHQGRDYILMVDYFSRWTEIRVLQNQTSHEAVSRIKSIFSTHGIPEVVMSDNGPQFSSDQFSAFAKAYEFTHVTSSPRYPQANGEAERAVRTIKELLGKNTDPYLALLAYRTSPLQNGFSPAELLMGRQLKTRLPVLPSHLKPLQKDPSCVESREAIYREKQCGSFNTRHRATDLPPLDTGSSVYIRDMERDGTVIQQTPSPRSYIVATDKGTVRRNRGALIHTPPLAGPALPITPSGDTKTPPNMNINRPPDSPRASSGLVIPTRVTRSGRMVRPPNVLDL